jgi:two-component system, NarL family, invasion response regulator UvrY
MKPIRLMIADDHPLIVEGLSSALRRYDIDVVAQVHSAKDVVPQFMEAVPDVVVLDVRFGEVMTGLDAARALLDRVPGARIVFYSQFDQAELIQEAYRIGGASFVPKNSAPAVLADVVRRVHEGASGKKPVLLPDIAERLALLSLQGDESPQAKLDPQALEVFKLLAQGLTNAEIVEQLGLSSRTISTLTQHVKEVLGVQRTADLTRLAIKHLLIEP